MWSVTFVIIGVTSGKYLLMYQGRSDLIQLVKSLSSSEKSYISKSFMKAGVGSGYQRLYDSIKGGESGMVQNNLNLPTGKRTDQKRGLYKFIRKHLRQMHQELSIDIVLQNNLTDIEILYGHSLPDQAIHLLEEAKKLALEHERFNLLLQILQWEQRLNIVAEKPTRSIEAIRKEEEAIGVKHLQILKLMGLYHQIVVMKKIHGYANGTVRKQLDSLLRESSGFPSEKQCKSIKARFYHDLILSLYNWMVFDHKLAYFYSNKLLLTQGRIILPEDYLNGLFQHITSCVCLAKFTEAINSIGLAELHMGEYNLDQNSARQQFFFIYDATYRIIIYTYTGNIEEMKGLIEEVELRLKSYAGTLPSELRQVMMGNLMNAYMAIGDYERAEQIWNQLFTHSSKRIRQDIYADLFLFRIFFLLQTGRYELVRSIALSANHYYSDVVEGRKNYAFEHKITRYFARSIKWEDNNARHKALMEVKSLFSDHIESKSVEICFQEHYSRYEIWCESIIKGIAFHRVAKEWYYNR